MVFYVQHNRRKFLFIFERLRAVVLFISMWLKNKIVLLETKIKRNSNKISKCYDIVIQLHVFSLDSIPILINLTKEYMERSNPCANNTFIF